MKRLCIFAHWDKNNIVEDYVIYYLKELSKICHKIIFVSDCNLTTQELIKLTSITEDIIAQKHGEYDFGSYKRGFLYAIEKKFEFDELIFANDSCYGPIYPLTNIFKKMEKKKCDFWGLTKNNYGLIRETENVPAWEPHIQSYFLVFYKNVFLNKIFIDKIKSIKKEENKNSIIQNYEIGLTQLLHKNGFKSCVYINCYNHTENYLISKWNKLIKKYKFPFIKTSIIKNGLYVTGEIKNWQKVLKTYSNYPTELIEKHSIKYQNYHENIYKQMNIYRKIRFNILTNSPMEIRYIVIYLEKNIFKILNKLCFNQLKKF